MIAACLMAVTGLWIVLPKPGTRVWHSADTPGQVRIRAGPRMRFGAGDTGDPLDVAADIDLFAACLDAGLSTRDSAHVVARVSQPHHREVWIQVVALLSIGVGAEKAFALMAGLDGLDELANLAAVSHNSGSALSQGCRRIAESLRDGAADHRTAAAERAGVFIALPLATCFLPAFMIIGLAPVVLSLGMNLLDIH